MQAHRFTSSFRACRHTGLLPPSVTELYLVLEAERFRQRGLVSARGREVWAERFSPRGLGREF